VYSAFQFIVIDGGSSDGSMELIKQNENLISIWISEKDNGIYHAMNKGIQYAQGKYVLFLNSGDYLIDEYALNIEFEQYEADFLYGHFTCAIDGKIFTTIYKEKLDLCFFYKTTLPHGSTFIKKVLFDRLGLYSEDFIIASDWIFFYKAILCHHCSYLRLDKYVSVFEYGGISTNRGNAGMVIGERSRFLNSELSEYVLDYLEETTHKLDHLKTKNQTLLSQNQELQNQIDNYIRLKGFKSLKKINNLIDAIYLIWRKKLKIL